MSKADLSTDQLQELADRLTSKRQELTDLVKSLSEVTGTKHDCEILDVADSASLNEMRVRAATLISQHSETMSEIDAALIRIKEYRYGVSETTGEPIDYKRLLVIPWARTAAND
jgi:RNA polymerase-binding transcription factor DksA